MTMSLDSIAIYYSRNRVSWEKHIGSTQDVGPSSRDTDARAALLEIMLKLKVCVKLGAFVEGTTSSNCKSYKKSTILKSE